MNILDSFFDSYSHLLKDERESNQNDVTQRSDGNDPVEQMVVESVADLEKRLPLTTKNLEAEAIYLAAFIYLKDSNEIDFSLNYFSNGLLDRIKSGNFSVADRVFGYMVKHGKDNYGQSEADYGIGGYKMNIRCCSGYGAYVKSYFERAHTMKSGSKYNLFSSPRNCLWRNGIKQIDSPTQRDVYYKIDGSDFELMIPPYNPRVAGKVISRTTDTIRCESSDHCRTFVFHYNGSVHPQNLYMIEMHRNDKGDMVSYHKQ